MRYPRSSGVLLHVTSLPGDFGIGDLGPEAYKFVDFLAASGQKVWEILPLTPIGYGNSPYSSPSAFAGNTLLVSPRLLVEDGLLSERDLKAAGLFPEDRVDYEAVKVFKSALLEEAWKRFIARPDPELQKEFRRFRRHHRDWLDDYCLFASLKQSFNWRPWYEWPEDLIKRNPESMELWSRKLAGQIGKQAFFQFLFFRQWKTLHAHAARRGVKIMGDLPFYVSHDSADVWLNRGFFLIDDQGRRTALSGVPPFGAFAVSQIWGNPLYNWQAMRADGYGWWLLRFAAITELVDIVRVDHFSGFYACWHVELEAKSSAQGRWVKSPATSFFRTLFKKVGKIPLVAEALEPDLAVGVEKLLKRLGYPGVRTLQYGFTGEADNTNYPPNYHPNCVVYTGTHDNDTLHGWYNSASAETKRHVENFLGPGKEPIYWRLIEAVSKSAADTVIFQLQDLLGLPSLARFNLPGQGNGQWEWRCRGEMISDSLARRMARLSCQTGR